MNSTLKGKAPYRDPFGGSYIPLVSRLPYSAVSIFSLRERILLFHKLQSYIQERLRLAAGGTADVISKEVSEAATRVFTQAAVFQARAEPVLSRGRPSLESIVNVPPSMHNTYQVLLQVMRLQLALVERYPFNDEQQKDLARLRLKLGDVDTSIATGQMNQSFHQLRQTVSQAVQSFSSVY